MQAYKTIAETVGLHFEFFLHSFSVVSPLGPHNGPSDVRFRPPPPPHTSSVEMKSEIFHRNRKMNLKSKSSLDLEFRIV